MPVGIIEESEEAGYDWKVMYLYSSEVTKTNARDTKKDTEKLQEVLEDKYFWINKGEVGERIQKVLEGVNPDDVTGCFDRWYDELEKKLTFPVEAVVAENRDGLFLRMGEKVKIISLSSPDDLYGMIVNVIYEGQDYEMALCDLEVKTKSSSNHQLIEDYRTWFANKS